MSLVGDFWTHPNVLYHYALLDLGLGPESFKAIQDDLASIIIMAVFSVLQSYLSFNILRHILQNQSSLPRSSRKSSTFSIVAVAVFVLYCAAAVLAIATFASKLSVAAKVNYWADERDIPPGTGYSCVLPDVFEGCPLFYTYRPSPLASRLDTALGAVFQAVVILADGLLLYRCFLVFRDKPWLYGTGAVVYLASIVIPLVYTGLMYTQSGPMTFNTDSGVEQGYGDISISLGDFNVGNLTLLHILVLSIGSSVLVNIIVTGSIAFRVIRARQRWTKLKSDLVYVDGDRSIDKSTVITILLEAALPPAILGLFICGMSLSRIGKFSPTYTHSLRVLWVSLIALAPQLIAVRVFQGKTWEQQQDEFAVSRPLQFAMDTVRSPGWLDVESPKPVRFRRLSEKPQVDAKYTSEGRGQKSWVIKTNLLDRDIAHISGRNHL